MTGLGLPMAECPEEIGLSAEQLERIRETLRQDVERRLIPGAVMLIARVAGSDLSRRSVFAIARQGRR